MYSTDENILKTPLYDFQLQNGGEMFKFAGIFNNFRLFSIFSSSAAPENTLAPAVPTLNPQICSTHQPADTYTALHLRTQPAGAKPSLD